MLQPLLVQRSSDRPTPAAAILTSAAADRVANGMPGYVPQGEDAPNRACFGIGGCPYHSGCAAYALVEIDPEATRIATCWMKGTFPLYVRRAA